ncbi:MAG: hypothetical protein M1817_006785 [Caeruleum heppii]|nr:MAG: hypothetical protein M1817_006785 [Caeruleum heppii]
MAQQPQKVMASSQPIVPSLVRGTLQELKANFGQVCVAIVLLSLIISVVNAVWIRYRHLSQYPGPSWAAYTRLWISKTIASGDSAQRFVDINKRYGSIARIGPNHLLTDDPELTRKVLAARSHWTRGPWFDAIKIDPHVPNIVSERHPGKHNHLRYQMSAGYAGKDIEGLEQAVDERITDFVDRIDRYRVSEPEESKVFDIARRIQFLTVDVITHLCFGKPLGFVETDSDVHGFLATIETQLPIVQHFSVILELNTIMLRIMDVKWLKRFLAPSSRDKTGIGMIMGISRRVVDERFLPNATKKNDMLGSFLKHGLSADEAETEISISLVAGSDTTATSMRATLLSIISNPRVYTRLVGEIDDAISRGLISSPIRDEEARRLPYLQACIKEGLRRFPPITQLRERMAPPEGETYKGQHIPAGTFLGLNAWGTQLNPVYGEDAEVFRPERWLIDDADRLARMSRVHELIFGNGPTRCLGIPIAMMNLNKIFVELLRRFDISVVNSAKPWTSVCYGIFFQKQFNVRITRRAQ